MQIILEDYAARHESRLVLWNPVGENDRLASTTIGTKRRWIFPHQLTITLPAGYDSIERFKYNSSFTAARHSQGLYGHPFATNTSSSIMGLFINEPRWWMNSLQYFFRRCSINNFNHLCFIDAIKAISLMVQVTSSTVSNDKIWKTQEAWCIHKLTNIRNFVSFEEISWLVCIESSEIVSRMYRDAVKCVLCGVLAKGGWLGRVYSTA